jgi:hypothetical protein
MRKSKEPKVVLFDVETSPCKVWAFRLGKTYLTHDKICAGERFDIITLAWKVLGEKKVHTLDWGLKKQDSGPMIEQFTKVLEDADLCVGHNSIAFDVKQVNTARLLHGQAPIAWPNAQDTLKELRKHFYLPSNRLDYVTKLLFGAGKDSMSFDDWVAIKERKDPKALAKMIKYNIKDVLLLEKLFLRIRPWIQAKPILPRTDAEECPSCGSKKSRSKGRRLLRNKFYQRRVCLACGHTFTGSKIE